jgi:hypothetical protein
LSDDPHLRAFYDKNQEALTKIHPDTRVIDVKNSENALPLMLKQRPRLNPENRLLAPEFFPTDSLDLPYGAIKMILDKTLAAVDGKPDNPSPKYMFLMCSFTTLDHKRLEGTF